jgi:hypothetical protein
VPINQRFAPALLLYIGSDTSGRHSTSPPNGLGDDYLEGATMSYFPGMQKGNLDSIKADAHGKIKKQTVNLQGVSVTRVTFDVGAKWSNDLKGYAGTDSCELPHVALVLSGTLRVVMDDGSRQELFKK